MSVPHIGSERSGDNVSTVAPDIDPCIGDVPTDGAAPDVEAALADLQGHVHGLLRGVGEDPEREGLRRTPLRVARSLRFLTDGYRANAEEVFTGALFESDTDEMVVVKDIELYSLCEHHMLPFFGRAHVAYLPNGRIVGLSKLARVVDRCADRGTASVHDDARRQQAEQQHGDVVHVGRLPQGREDASGVPRDHSDVGRDPSPLPRPILIPKPNPIP